MKLWLKPIPENIRDLAVKAFEDGDAVGFLCKADNSARLDLVSFNFQEMKAGGIYEAALLHALTATHTNNFQYHLRELRYFLKEADRDRLRAAGDPLPGAGPFTVYRGVAGRGPARHVRGVSWTASLETAWWFARRFEREWELDDPAVFEVTVDADAVCAYINDREEQEFIVLLPDSAKPRRVRE